MIINLCPTKEQFEKALDQAEDMMLAIEDNQLDNREQRTVKLVSQWCFKFILVQFLIRVHSFARPIRLKCDYN